MRGIFILSLVLMATSAYAGPTESPEVQVARGNAQFANDLYKFLSTERDTNVAFSPLSAHMCLSMLYQGTSGSTKEVCAKGLRVADPTIAAEGYKSLINTFHEKPSNHEEGNEVTLEIANKAYVSTGGQLKDTFKTAVQEKFGSEVESIDFSNGEVAAGTINKWVKDKTKEKISELVNKNQVQDANLVLINAVYFKATWLHQFDVGATKTRPFHLSSDKTVDVPMMYIQKHFTYKNDDKLNAKIVELPYRDSAYSMVIILPNDKNGIRELEEKLVTYDINELLQGGYEDVKLTLPKFKIESSLSLADPLKQMGMEEIFSGNADLSGIVEGTSPRVSDVIHKVFVQVDEYGSEAAAASAVLLLGSSFNPPPPVEFVADHPFVFMLTHKKKSLSVLFYGRVYEPKF